MIVPFILDPASFRSPEALTEELETVHELFLELWLRFGVLVHEGDSFRGSEVDRCIETLPQRIRKKWREVAERNRIRMRPAPAGWQGMTSVTSRESLKPIKGSADAAFVGPEFGVRLGMSEGEECIFCEEAGVEIVRFTRIGRSTGFRRARDLSEAWIVNGTTVEQVWRERFAGFAGLARNVTVVDRFAFDNSFVTNIEECGFRTFLKQLSTCAKSCTVTVFTCSNPPSRRDLPPLTGAEVRDQLERVLGGLLDSGIDTCMVYFVPNRAFRDDSHGRYLRFDHSVFVTDKGVDLFNGSVVKGTHQFSYQLLSSGQRDIERALRRHSTAFERFEKISGT